VRLAKRTIQVGRWYPHARWTLRRVLNQSGWERIGRRSDNSHSSYRSKVGHKSGSHS
jgi:hypothetical protein